MPPCLLTPLSRVSALLVCLRAAWCGRCAPCPAKSWPSGTSMRCQWYGGVGTCVLRAKGPLTARLCLLVWLQDEVRVSLAGTPGGSSEVLNPMHELPAPVTAGDEAFDTAIDEAAGVVDLSQVGRAFAAPWLASTQTGMRSVVDAAACATRRHWLRLQHSCGGEPLCAGVRVVQLFQPHEAVPLAAPVIR